jgi:hypothetical protein
MIVMFRRRYNVELVRFVKRDTEIIRVIYEAKLPFVPFFGLRFEGICSPAAKEIVVKKIIWHKNKFYCVLEKSETNATIDEIKKIYENWKFSSINYQNTISEKHWKLYD